MLTAWNVENTIDVEEPYQLPPFEAIPEYRWTKEESRNIILDVLAWRWLQLIRSEEPGFLLTPHGSLGELGHTASKGQFDHTYHECLYCIYPNVRSSITSLKVRIEL